MVERTLKQYSRIKEILGYKLVLSGYETDNYYADVMRSEGVYDDDLLLALKAASKVSPTAQMLDVGANIGYVTCMLAKFNPKVKIHAFEPLLSNVKLLQNNIEQNEAKNVTVHAFGLGNSNQTTAVSWDPGNRGSAFITKTRHEIYPNNEEVKIKVLDKIYNDLDITDCGLIKLDIEGYELEFLRGSQAFLKQYKPTVIMEANHWCLNALQNITLPAFLNELFETFEHVHAFWGNRLIDVREHRELYMYENIVNNRYMNLICSFDKRTHTKILNNYSELTFGLDREENKIAEHRAKENAKKIIRQQLKISELEAANKQLREAVAQTLSLRWQTKNMYTTLDTRIMTAIDRRGYGIKPIKKKVHLPKDMSSYSPQEIIYLTWQHDVKKYFSYRASRTKMKFRYKLISKAYRTTRDVTKSGLKKSYRATKRARG